MTAAKLWSLLLYIFASLIQSKQIPLNLAQFVGLRCPHRYWQTRRRAAPWLRNMVLTQEFSLWWCASFSVSREGVPGVNLG